MMDRERLQLIWLVNDSEKRMKWGLLGPERIDWVHAGRPPRGQPAGEEGDGGKEHGDGREDGRVERMDAV